MDIELLRLRAALFKGIRSFFDEHGYLEVDTPSLAPDLIPESCLEVFATEYRAPAGSRRPVQELYLIPSPEIWMKKLLAQHKTSIYQLCHAFRNGESTGRRHSPEFAMLEYYTVHADWMDSLAITEALVDALVDAGLALPGEGGGSAARAPLAICPPFRRMSVAEAFESFAGFPLYETAREGPACFAARARDAGVETAREDMGIADLYNLVFVDKVEPSLPQDRPLALTDYPSFVPCLARPNGSESFERWELYMRGVEIANCYSEERDQDRVAAFFAAEAAEKARTALVPHAVDSSWPRIFASFPRASGVALGVDRLFMVLQGRSSIDNVLPFPLGD